MTHSFTQSFTHSLTQEQDNATRLHLSPTTEHHTNSHPAPSLELKLASLRRSQPARKSSTPHTPQPLQLPNDVVSMAKLGVFFSVFFPPVSVFMVTMLPLVLLGVGMSHNTVPRNRYNMQKFFLVDTFCHQPILLIDAVSLFFFYQFSGRLLRVDMGCVCSNRGATFEVLQFPLGSSEDFKVEPDPLPLDHPHQHLAHPCRLLFDKVSTLDNARLSGFGVSFSLFVFIW